MDADAIFKESLSSLGYKSVRECDSRQLIQFSLRFAIWPSIETYLKSPWLAPFAIRRQRVRMESNAPGEKRDLWGLPTDLGYFADDNSLIKSLALKKPLSSEGSPYGANKVTKGLVCCHIWAGTTSNPLLFSFVPNLVWLPKSLAMYSDAHHDTEPHPVHHALKRVSLGRYVKDHPIARVASAWALLENPEYVELPEFECTEIADGGRIADLAEARVNRMINFLEAILDPNSPLPRRFSKRYHAGVGSGIDRSVYSVQDSLSVNAIRALLAEMRQCRQ